MNKYTYSEIFPISSSTNHLLSSTCYLLPAISAIYHPNPARAHHDCILVKNELVIFGGNSSANQPSNEIWSFDVEKRQWVQYASNGDNPPPAMENHTLTLVSGKGYLIGSNGVWLLQTDKLEVVAGSNSNSNNNNNNNSNPRSGSISNSNNNGPVLSPRASTNNRYVVG